MTTLGSSDRPMLPPRVQSMRDEEQMPRPPAAASGGASLGASIGSAGFAICRMLVPQRGVGAPHPLSSLANRSAGEAVIAETLRIQGQEPSRSWWRRLVGASPPSAQSCPWFKGALGEIAVGQILVWVGERAVLVAGQIQHYLPHARHEATRAAKRFAAAVGEPVPVTPVLVLIKPGKLVIKQRLADASVVTDRQLLRWLRRRRPVLTPEQVARIGAAAVPPGTWHDDPAPPQNPVELQERFADLQASVRSARRCRVLWGLGLLTAGGAAAIGNGSAVLMELLNAGLP